MSRRSSWGVAVRVALVALFALAAGCGETKPATQVIVTVDADDAVALRTARVRVRVLSTPGIDAPTEAMPFDGNVPGPVRWPVVLALAPRDGDVARGFVVEATAYDARDGVVTVARARSGYVSGRTLWLRVRLEASCIGTSCTAEQTCTAGACTSARVDPSTLPDAPSGFDGGTVVGDAGAVVGDAGTDAGNDAGPDYDGGSDAGYDAGPEYDGGTDAGYDAGPGYDAGMDAGFDSGPGYDAGRDAGYDAGYDAGIDAGYDAGYDAGPPPAAGVTAGYFSSGARMVSGSLRTWGNNFRGELGDGTTTTRARPVAVLTVTDAVGFDQGDNHACAIRPGGGILCWGDNAFGELGNGVSGATMYETSPVAVAALGGSGAQVAAGAAFTCAALTSGVVRCWGQGGAGQLGAGAVTMTATPVDVMGLAGVTATAVATGSSHACALGSTGQLYCWGSNSNGELGLGTASGGYAGAQVTLATGVTAVAGGNGFTCVIRNTTHEVACFGQNNLGQTGTGDAVAHPTPTTTGLTGAVSVCAGQEFACAATTAGSVYCWGSNSQRQLGDGVATHVACGAVDCARAPGGAAVGLTDAVAVACGGEQACALRSGGGVVCWGSNSSGQVGDGGGLSVVPAPSAVTGL